MTKGKKNTETRTDGESSSLENSVIMNSKLENILEQLASGMIALQQTVGNLSLQVNKKSGTETTPVAVADRSYILNWKELGGSTLCFYPNSKTHPKAFIKKINKILDEAGVPEQFKTGLALPCLKGTAADWASVKESSFKTFKDFEEAFLNRFWGVDKQRDLFLQLNYGRFDSGNRAEYFLNLANQAGFLSEPIPETKLIEMLSKHFPPDIQRGIVTQGLFTIDEVEEYLRKIDETYASEASLNVQNRGNNNYRRNNASTGGYTRDPPLTNARNIERNTQPDNREQTRMNYITRFNEGEEVFLSDSESDIEDNELSIPIIKASIASINIEILLDSGSEITAVSETFYDKISKNISVAILPVSNVTVAVAIGGKKQRIKYQVLLPISIQGTTYDIRCLIVPNLNTDILFGFDWLTKYKAHINFSQSLLYFSYENKEHIVEFDKSLNNESSPNINLCAKETETEVINLPDKRHQYTETDFTLAVEKTNLGESDKQKLYKLLKSYTDIFSECPGQMKSYMHEIEMRDKTPFNCPSYPIPFIYREEVKEQITEMLAWGIIKKEKTEYISPLVTVKKKDGSVRICLDARRLNEKMKKDYVTPPNPNELLLNFKKGQLLSTIDLTAAYWQIPIKGDHTKYIGFIYEGESYTFSRLPFGLSTSMASLIRGLNKILAECSTFTAAYVDDLLIFSENLEMHLNNLKKIFEIFRSEGITVKLRKCQFVRSCVTFLGHIISSEGVAVDPKRIQAINNFPDPRNIRELRGFLGLVNYEQRFCENYSDLTITLVKLLRKGEVWRWGENEKKAFQNIKDAYLRTTIVIHPDIEKTFYIQCDGSDYAVGGCLFQLADKNEKQVIAYTSATLKGSQVRYTTTEKEMWALIHCLRQWRTLVLGRDLVILSDHKALSFMLSCKLRSARLSRWIMFLQEFDFKIIHCKGSENVVADILSRNPIEKDYRVRPEKSNDIKIMLTNMTKNYDRLKENFKVLREDQLGETWIKDKIQFLERIQKEVPIFIDKQIQILEWFTVYEGLLFKRGDNLNPGFKLCVPRSQVKELVVAHHIDLGHFGKTKTYHQMRQKFYWPKMQRHVRQIVAGCDLCQRAKSSKTNRGLMNSAIPKKPGNLVCVDLLGPLPVARGGVTQLLVLVDAFSKFVKLYALKRATAKAILNKVLNDYIPNVQKPECILSDNGTQFTGNEWMRVLDREGIRVKHISIYFPEGNMTERYNKEIGRLLRSYCFEKHTRWANMLDFVEKCLNNSINESTGYAPVYLQFGKPIEQPINKYVEFPKESQVQLSRESVWVLAYERLCTKAQKRAEKYNVKINPVTFHEGDKVLVRTHNQSSVESRTIKKFFLLFEGPFYIARQAGPNSYILCDENGKEHSKQNIVNLKLFKEAPEKID